MSRFLQRGSSAIDWCENNYSITTTIAEFYNTISNVLFFVIPPILIHLFRNYARQVSWEVNVVWVLMTVVGIGSAYFHATLSLIGQLLDEIAILWVIMASVAIWFPQRLLPGVFQHNRASFKLMVALGTLVSSGLACLAPVVNAFVLMTFGLPMVVVMFMELGRCDCPRINSLGLRCGLMWLCAVTLWINDKIFCDVWSAVNFPYLHCGWHIMIFIASYTACVLFAYFDAIATVPEQMPVLKYWPRDSWDRVGIPYVTLKRVQGKPPTTVY